MAHLAGSGLLGVVASSGSAYSHSAILARSLDLPMLVGVRDALSSIHDDDLILLDAERGEAVVHPTAQDLARYRSWQREAVQRGSPPGHPRQCTHAHARWRRHTPSRQCRDASRHRHGARAWRRWRRPLSHRIPVPSTEGPAHRGRAVHRLPRPRPGHGRPAGHHSHAGPWRRQGRCRGPGLARRGQSGAGRARRAPVIALSRRVHHADPRDPASSLLRAGARARADGDAAR